MAYPKFKMGSVFLFHRIKIYSKGLKNILTPFLLRAGSRLALLASYLLQPAATPVTLYEKIGFSGHSYPHR
jgi:hypothetical protein